MPYVDFSLVVEGLVATGMPPIQIARKIGVGRSTVCRWRQGLVEPRAWAADALLDLAERYTASRLNAFQKRNGIGGT